MDFNMELYLKATPTLDAGHERIVEAARTLTRGCSSDEEKAVRLFAAAEESLASIGAPLGPADIAEMERDLAIAQEKLSADEFSLAWSIGTRYTVEQAIAQAKDLADTLLTGKNNSSD